MALGINIKCVPGVSAIDREQRSLCIRDGRVIGIGCQNLTDHCAVWSVFIHREQLIQHHDLFVDILNVDRDRSGRGQGRRPIIGRFDRQSELSVLLIINQSLIVDGDFTRVIN